MHFIFCAGRIIDGQLRAFGHVWCMSALPMHGQQVDNFAIRERPMWTTLLFNLLLEVSVELMGSCRIQLER